MTTRRRQPEAQLQRSLVEHLRWCAKADVWFAHIPNGGARGAIEGAIFKALGVRPGAPDLLIVRAGQALFIECKAPGRKLSRAQVECHEALRRAGGADRSRRQHRRGAHVSRAARGAAMSERRRLRNRRGSTTFAIESQGLAFTVTVSAFDSGELAEIFITNHRANSGAGIMASDCAIAASLALQYGCPADVLRKALSRDSHGRANGPLGAALDQIFQASSHGCDKGEAPAIRRQHEEP